MPRRQNQRIVLPGQQRLNFGAVQQPAVAQPPVQNAQPAAANQQPAVAPNQNAQPVAAIVPPQNQNVQPAAIAQQNVVPARYRTNDVLPAIDPAWLIQFNWLRHDVGANLMYCHVCRTMNPGGRGAFVEGTNNWKKGAIYSHIRQHAERVQAFERQELMIQQNAAANNAIQDHLTRLTEEQENTMVRMFKTAFRIGFYSLPFEDFERQLIHMKDLAPDINFGTAYHNRPSCRTFIGFIAKSILKSLGEDISSANYFSAMFDCGTLKTGAAVIIGYVKFIGIDGKVRVECLGMEEITGSPNADNLYGLVVKILGQNLGVQDWRIRMLGLGLDGTNVNLGEHQSMSSKLKEQTSLT